VFIEATKPLFEANQESAEKVSAQNTLYTCLEGGLKLLHPFMPYVTEDLWQRLPRREGDKCESIMVSSFPEEVSQLGVGENGTNTLRQIPEQNFPEDAADFDLVFKCIQSARSVSSSFNLPTNGKTIEDKITGMSSPVPTYPPLIPEI
jgi:valyl-tRNA synthetase